MQCVALPLFGMLQTTEMQMENNKENGLLKEQKDSEDAGSKVRTLSNTCTSGPYTTLSSQWQVMPPH